MGTEDDIGRLIAELEGRKRQGFHVSPSAVGLIIEALRFYLAARLRGTSEGQARPAREPRELAKGPRSEPFRGPPATIGNARANGVKAVHVHCAGPHCHNQRRFTFEGLAVGDDLPVPDIARVRRFTCQRCGSRRVSVSLDWRDANAPGSGRARG